MTKMKLSFPIVAILLLLCTACSKNQQTNANMTETILENAPVAKIIPEQLEAHGDIRTDNYYWLRERENPEVIDYLKAENAYTESALKHTEKLQETLFNEMKGRIKQNDNSVPYKSRDYLYYVRYEEGKEYPIYCRKKGSLEADEEIMLNANVLAEGHGYHRIGATGMSESQQVLAYAEDTVGRRIYTIRFKNLATGEMLSDEIPASSPNIVWANDNQHLFYTKKDSVTLRSHQIYKHTIGTPHTEDELVFEEKDETFSTYISKTKSRKYLTISSYSTLATEYRILESSNPNGSFRVFQPRGDEHEYSIDHFQNKFYVVTNWKAKNFRLMETPENKTRKSNWKEVIAHRKNVLLEGMELFNDFFVLEERQDGLNKLRIIKWEDQSEHYLDFGEAAYSAYVTNNREMDSKTLRYAYESMTTPASVFDYNMESREKELMKEQEVLGGFDKGAYKSERIFVEVRDGAKVPVSIVYKKSTPLDGTSPLLLYAYGSYGYSLDPYFSSARLSLLDRGFVYAIAHIRGGSEMGRDWYEDGKMLKKKNTFNDFIDCAETMIQKNYASPEKLYAMGGSAGGLLMGAVVNMRPELFDGIVAQVPFVDVITTMLDESIPLTTGEYDEWGNPNEKEYYNYILSYSPYDNVEEKAYPNMLVTTGLHDSQVQYWEPAKWVAKLRALKTDQNLLLLHTNMEAGHGGASGRFEAYKEVALGYAFLLDLAKEMQ